MLMRGGLVQGDVDAAGLPLTAYHMLPPHMHGYWGSRTSVCSAAKRAVVIKRHTMPHHAPESSDQISPSLTRQVVDELGVLVPARVGRHVRDIAAVPYVHHLLQRSWRGFSQEQGGVSELTPSAPAS